MDPITKFLKYKKSILLIALFAFTISLYNSDKVMYKIPKLLQQKISIGIDNRFGMYIREPLMKSIASINPSNWLTKPSSNLPRFYLTLNRSNMDYMKAAIDGSDNFMDETINQYQACKIEYDNKVYKCDVRLHGTDTDNFIGKKKSFAIKLKKDGLIDNMRRFSFIPSTKHVSAIPVIFSYKLLNQYFDFDVKSELVYLHINGINQGLFLLEEKAHKTVLERNNNSGVDIIKANDRWNSQYHSTHQDPYSIFSSYLKYKNISEKDLGQLLKYRMLIENINSYKTVSKFVDIDKFAQFDAMRFLFGTYGIIEGDNSKYLYNTSNGRLSPYPRFEGSIYDLKHNNYSSNFESFLYTTSLLPTPAVKLDDNKLLQTLIKNNQYRTLRNKYVNIFLEDKSMILDMYDLLLEKYISDIRADTTGDKAPRFYLMKTNDARRALVGNFNKISEYINYSRTFTDILQTGDNKYLIEIKSDSNVPTRINSLKFYFGDQIVAGPVTVTNLQNKTTSNLDVENITEYFNDKEFMLNLDGNLDNEIKVYKYEIDFNGLVNIDRYEIEYKNTITEDLINPDNTYTSFLKKPENFNFHFISQSVEDFIDSNKDLTFAKEKDGSITLKSGDYFIKNNLILPYGIDLNIEAGTKLKIENRKSLLVYGALNINGKPNLPVVISSIHKNKPFGVVAAIGSDQSVCNISYLDISNGSESMMNGSYLSGALSLYSHKKVLITDSKVHNNFADDGLNVKNADVEIRNSKFYENFADQVDLDFTNAIVAKSFFVASEKDDNGDGLDLSGSIGVIFESNFENFSDKGISVGENTTLFIYNNNFENNRSAITGKDQSKLYFYENNYKNNLLNIEAYIKKPIFNSPNIFILNEKHTKDKVSIKDNSNYYFSNENIGINEQINLDIFERLDQMKWLKSK
jgi:hypothetical protein